jgi:hypothetical protein
MDVFYEKLPKAAECCINCFETETAFFDVPWHFHPETEILYIEKSTGLRFVGDHSESFGAGDIGMIGSNLPHVWKNDSIYRQNIAGLMHSLFILTKPFLKTPLQFCLKCRESINCFSILSQGLNLPGQ